MRVATRFFGYLLLTTAALLVLFSGQALALVDVGSDGSSGVFRVAGTRSKDLSRAVTGSWNQPGDSLGVYDPDKWAVVFRYDSVYVAAGRTLTFVNHPSGAPVVWLVKRGVRIEGSVNLNGEGCALWSVKPYAEPGPGGFRGGRATAPGPSTGSAGMGPGGGAYRIGSGSYGGPGSYGTVGTAAGAGPTYGNDRILPLIGGSGGGGPEIASWGGGGAGGGAILVAAGRAIDLFQNSAIYSNGGLGNFGGSGGAIRLVADQVAGLGQLQCSNAYSGGKGRIRIEANTITYSGGTDPIYVPQVGIPGNIAIIWPPSDAPAVRVTSVAGQPVPTDPRASFGPPGDLSLSTSTPVEVLCEGTNIPVSGWKVTVRVARKSGQEFSVDATFTGGNQAVSTWTAVLPQVLPAADMVAVQARASKL
jgi:hypothetical protein